MRASIAVVIGALLFCACTKKDKDDKGGDKSAEKVADKGGGEPSKLVDDKKPAAPKKDPWGAAPAEVKTQLGAQTGAKLAKVTATAPTAGLTAKVDPKTIEKPAEQVQIKGFASDDAPPSGFSVVYNKSANATHEEFRAALQQNHVFDTVAEGLNKTVRIPHNVQIQTVDCNTVNAFYDPNNNRIIVCYELLDYFISTFKPHAKSEDELGASVIGATIFSFYHEAGHGLIHQLDLPSVGREEDSVDQLATLILIGEGEKGVQMALSGAYWFKLQTDQEHKTPFWDEHGFDGQRFYNILCLIYGSNPEKYASFVNDDTLPEARAKRCPEEYRKINRAWEKLLQPYLTNGAAANVDYKPNVAPHETPKSNKSDPWGDGEAGNSANKVPEPQNLPKNPNAGGGWGDADNNDDSKNGGGWGDAKETSGGGWGDAEAPKAITCEDVANKAAQLIGAEAAERAKSMSEEQIEELKERLQTQLPAAMQTVLAKCAKEKWSDASRKCVLDAGDLATAEKCK